MMGKRFLLLFCLIMLFAINANPTFAQEKPEIFVQLGHSDSVRAASFSSDGKYLVSGGGDKVIKLW